MMHRNNRLKESAQHAPCLMNSPRCDGGVTDVCWRHSNHLRHGKGRGIKAHDLFGAFGCQGCEDYYSGGDLPKEEKLAFFLEAWERSMIYACEKGIL